MTDMDDFDYLQDDALSKWLDTYFVDDETKISIMEREFLPRFERDIYLNMASKSISAANRATDVLREPVGE